MLVKNSLLTVRFHGHLQQSAKKIALKFDFHKGAKKEQLIIEDVPINNNILEVCHNYNIPLEGACEGSLACSTCHVVLEKELFDKLPEMSIEEEDLLDLAPGVKDTSRLGCQCILNETWYEYYVRAKNPIRIQIPKDSANFYVDGHIPEAH